MSQYGQTLKHARRRCRQRLHVKLTRPVHAGIVCDIERGRAEFVCTDPGSGREIWLVQLCGRFITAVFERATRLIVTVMHAAAAEGYREWARHAGEKGVTTVGG